MCFTEKRYKNLATATDAVGSSRQKNTIDLVIIPPEIDEQTDEEDINDDTTQEEVCLPNDVPGEIEIQWDHDGSEAEDSDEEYDVLLSVLQSRLNKEAASSRMNDGEAGPSCRKRNVDPGGRKKWPTTQESKVAPIKMDQKG
ncbi:hypothetical protein NQ314_010546 [Rhamnusium bicolor]|uniref:Uncharacterized protein n=1 Tax=Rhamnusium bicolor TaxID=1586634 RepID=A0AAV8XPQ5_9CUCU|nr:hypothetical protein NQ314_010546 [Rhamnusium bicolor]